MVTKAVVNKGIRKKEVENTVGLSFGTVGNMEVGKKSRKLGVVKKESKFYPCVEYLTMQILFKHYYEITVDFYA